MYNHELDEALLLFATHDGSSVFSEMDTAFLTMQTKYRLAESQKNYMDIKSIVRNSLVLPLLKV